MRTPCGRFIGTGLIDSHGSHHSASPFLPFCVFIITRLRWFVKTLFEFFQKDFFNLYCTLTSLCTRQGFVASFISHLGCVPLLYHTLRALSRGFYIFFRDFFSLPSFCGSVPVPVLRPRPLGVLSLPLTFIIIS